MGGGLWFPWANHKQSVLWVMSHVAHNVPWLIRKSHTVCTFTQITLSDPGNEERKCTTVMTTQICFVSFWPTELSKKHLMLKWGQEKVKKCYMSAVMNIWTADLKRLAVFMREVARVTSFSLSHRWAALALTTTGF